MKQQEARGNAIYLNAVQFQQLLSIGSSKLAGLTYCIEDYSTIQHGKVIAVELRRSIKFGGIDFVLGNSHGE